MDNKPFTILILLNATPQWLSLSRNQRSEFVLKELSPIIEKVGAKLDIRFFDSEYFHAHFSDFLIIQTVELIDYQLFIEMLRDTKFYGVPHFKVLDIVIGKENLFKEYDKQLKSPN